jgi:hypothetical protein
MPITFGGGDYFDSQVSPLLAVLARGRHPLTPGCVATGESYYLPEVEVWAWGTGSKGIKA